jgi:hypothetical protein
VVLHPSAFSLARLGAPTIEGEGDEERVLWGLGSTKDSLGRSLHAPFWTFGQTVSLIVDEFDPASRDGFDERSRAARRVSRFRPAHQRLKSPL